MTYYSHDCVQKIDKLVLSSGSASTQADDSHLLGIPLFDGEKLQANDIKIYLIHSNPAVCVFILFTLVYPSDSIFQIQERYVPCPMEECKKPIPLPPGE